jgi:hypothetical protein
LWIEFRVTCGLVGNWCGFQISYMWLKH